MINSLFTYMNKFTYMNWELFRLTQGVQIIEDVLYSLSTECFQGHLYQCNVIDVTRTSITWYLNLMHVVQIMSGNVSHYNEKGMESQRRSRA